MHTPVIPFRESGVTEEQIRLLPDGLRQQVKREIAEVGGITLITLQRILALRLVAEQAASQVTMSLMVFEGQLEVLKKLEICTPPIRAKYEQFLETLLDGVLAVQQFHGAKILRR